MARIVGKPGVDHLIGSVLDDVIRGLAGNDQLYGDLGKDHVYGGPDDDEIHGGGDDDVLHGDTGNDALYGEDGEDRLLGGAGQDVLDGGSGDDLLNGGRGSDVYVQFAAFGFPGFDTIEQTSGDRGAIDTVYFGSGLLDLGWEFRGDDLIIAGLPQYDSGYDESGYIRIEDHYSGAVDGLAYFEADLIFDNGFYTDPADGGIARIYTPTRPVGTDQGPYTEIVRGTTGDDLVLGNGGYRDYLYGDLGDDVLLGSDETMDTLRSGPGNDQLFGFAGNDRLQGGAGDDLLDGGEGFDRLEFNGLTAAGLDVTAGVTVDLRIQGEAQPISAEQGSDTLVSIEAVRGSAFADSLMGDEGDNHLFGEAGNDGIEGNGGFDFILGGEGDDFVAGGDGDDHLDGGQGSDETNGGGGNDELHSGGAPLTFDGSDVLFGGEGDDTFYAEGGFVQIFGEAGNDTIIGVSTYAGDPYFYNDWVGVDYSTSEGDVLANFTDTELGGLLPGQVADGTGGTDTVSGITALRDGSGNDAFYFDQSFRALNGEASWLGENSVFVTLSAGNDLADFTGMTGMRVVRWASDGGVYADLAEGYATDLDPADGFIGTDTFINANGLRGTRHDDHLVGDENDNSFAGGRGNDVIDGGGGDRDYVGFGNSTDGIHVDLSLASDQVVSDGLGGTDTLTGIEGVQGSDFDDYIVGDLNANLLQGNVGADVLHGGGGADTIDGNQGADTLAGEAGDDTFILKAIWADGDIIADFEGAGAVGGDLLLFESYGPASTLSNVGDDWWTIEWSGGTDRFQIAGVISLDEADYMFA